MSTSDSTVCVVGGGIAGMAAAHSIGRAEPDVRVVLCEARDRLGGIVQTDSIEGTAVEVGPDSFLARDAAMVDLCREVGLGGELVAPAVFGGLVWTGDRLEALPSGFVYGLPASAGAALRARILSPAGRARAALEGLLPGPRLTQDVSVGELVRKRFGPEVLERIVDPLLAGTRAGDVDHMSVEAALPTIWAALRGRRAITPALSGAPGSAGPPPFLTVTGGLNRLVEALRRDSPSVEFRTNTRVDGLMSSDAGFRLTTSGGAIEATAVVVALPAPEAAQLLTAVRPDTARSIASIRYASVATAVLVFPPGAGAPPAGSSGLLVPSLAGATMSACTWYSVKWPQARPDDGGLVLRCFAGRTGDGPAAELSDEELVARLSTEARAALGLTADHRTARVTRWTRALPQYTVGHRARVDAIENDLAARPGVWVTGAAYRGSGLPDCVRHAQHTASEVVRWLRAVG